MAFAALSVIVLFPVDCAVWRWRGPIAWEILARPSGTLILAALLAVSLINAVLVHGYLARKAPDEQTWPVWLRMTRFVLGGFPLVGLCTVPVWRRLRERRPRWTLRRRPPAPAGLATEGAAAFVTWRRWTDRLEASGSLLWVSLSGLAVLVLAACWTAARAMERPVAHRALVALACGLHLLFFAVLLPHCRRTARQRHLPRGSSALLAALPALWLIPFPFFPIAAGHLLYFRISGDNAQSVTLIFRALIRRKEAGRLPAWLELEDRLRRPGASTSRWQPLATPLGLPNQGPEAGRTERQLLKLYDLKCYGLGFDTAALAWSLAWLSEREPGWAGPLQAFYRIVIGISLLAFLAGASIVSADVLQRALRMPGRRLLVRHPWASSLAKGHFAALCGWLLGWYLRIADISQLGLLAQRCAALLVVLKALTVILGPAIPRGRWRRRLADNVPLLAILFTVAILGGIGAAVDLMTPALLAWVLTWPLRALLVGRRLVPPLLRPFRWADVVSPRLPRRSRALLAGLALPAVLPFGGLAVPAWIVARQRGWKAMTSLWWRKEIAE